MAEKRDITRYRKRLSLKFGTEMPVNIGFTDDISLDGLFVKTARTYPLKTILNIELFTKDHKVVNITGIVMWVKKIPMELMHFAKKGGMGIRIIKITAGEEIYKALLQHSV